MTSVKVLHLRENNMGALLECLRYAGVISRVETAFEERDDVKTLYTFEINAPKGVHEGRWADMNARRIKSFNLRAEVKK